MVAEDFVGWIAFSVRNWMYNIQIIGPVSWDIDAVVILQLLLVNADVLLRKNSSEKENEKSY